MKKKIMGWFTAFALACVLGLVTFSENASASTNTDMINSTNAIIGGEWEETFRLDNDSYFSKNRKFFVQVHNVSFEGGEYLVRLYKPGTSTVIFERSGYIGPKELINHDYMTPSSMNFTADSVWYRKSGSNAEILGMVYANRD